MSFRFAEPRPRRRPSLTPMIDVVFLLLVFFMLAARFGQEGVLDLRIAGGGGTAWEGPPRLVQVEAEGVRLNGQAVEGEELVEALRSLVETDSDLVLIQPAEGVALQRLLDVMALLEAGGLTSLALVDP
ncbi:ExbD/TolR family protein [Roseicyclus persicicus]|uniref:Biopolymer transporter ExbD n=1 Tax=Roseicyclus persicicus TaxID=2650661 RepID=A0A7X6GZ94_9RHOB|nr:biopolymer transporter ExbD [Roseibacterium persicicum]NKX45141.1 biopolymer transporter ExbD [Roseibacterium persicicum]